MAPDVAFEAEEVIDPRSPTGKDLEVLRVKGGRTAIASATLDARGGGPCPRDDPFGTRRLPQTLEPDKKLWSSDPAGISIGLSARNPTNRPPPTVGNCACSRSGRDIRPSTATRSDRDMIVDPVEACWTGGTGRIGIEPTCSVSGMTTSRNIPTGSPPST